MRGSFINLYFVSAGIGTGTGDFGAILKASICFVSYCGQLF